MFANTKFILLTLTAFKVFITSGFVNMTCSTTRPEYEDSETCTCTTDSGTGIEWQKDGTSFLLCYIGGTCDATLPAYDVAYSASGSIKIFSITVKSFMYPDCGSFSCKDQDAVDTETKQLTLYDFNKSVPSVIQEPGTKESGKIEITTDCLFKDSNEVVVLWYTVKEGEQPKEYFPDEKYITSTNCSDAAKTCSGEKAVILNIGFVHTEKTRECVQFRLEVYHILNATEKLELTTSSQYCIKGPTTTTTTTSSITNTSTVPTVTTSTTTSTTTTSNYTSDNTGIIVGACVGSVALLLGICIFVCRWLRSKTNNTKKEQP